METAWHLVAWIFAPALLLYAAVSEFLDIIGRLETMEKRWPKVHSAMSNRPMRLVLIAFSLVVLGKDVVEHASPAIPSLIVDVKAPPPPIVQFSTPSMQAPKFSKDDKLRRPGSLFQSNSGGSNVQQESSGDRSPNIVGNGNQVTYGDSKIPDIPDARWDEFKVAMNATSGTIRFLTSIQDQQGSTVCRKMAKALFEGKWAVHECHMVMSSEIEPPKHVLSIMVKSSELMEPGRPNLAGLDILRSSLAKLLECPVSEIALEQDPNWPWEGLTVVIASHPSKAN